MTATHDMLEVIRDVRRDPCLCYRLRQITRAVSQIYDEAMRPAGLKSTQYSLLSVIAGRQPVNFNELARQTSSDKTTIARNLKLLAQRGLVRYEPGEDRREREARLTRKGEEKLIQAWPLWKAAQQRMRRVMGRSRVEGLIGELTRAANDIRAA